jgi:voltage-gated potassium channel Kch
MTSDLAITFLLILLPTVLLLTSIVAVRIYRHGRICKSSRYRHDAVDEPSSSPSSSKSKKLTSLSTQTLSRRAQLKLWLASSTLGFAWACVQVALTLLAVALYVASTYLTESGIVLVIDVCVTSLFALDYALHFAAAGDKLKFFFKFFSLVDWVTVLPLWALVVSGQVYDDDLEWLRALRLLRALRIIRIYRLMMFTKNLVQRRLVVVVLTVFNLLFLTAALFQIVEESTPTLDGEPAGSVSIRFHTAFYFVVVTLSTVGYGDEACRTEAGRVVVMCSLAVAFVLLPIQTSRLVAAFTQMPRYHGAFKSRKRHVVLSGALSLPALTEFFREHFHEEARNGHAKVVVFSADEPAPGVERLLRKRFYKRCVKYLRGSPARRKDLVRRAKLPRARAILIFADKFASSAASAASADARALMYYAAAKQFEPSVRACVQVVCAESASLVVDAPGRRDDAGGAQRDTVLCTRSLRLGMLGLECAVPSAAAMLLNLLRCYVPPSKAGGERERAADRAFHEYHHGLCSEIYELRVPPVLDGRSFAWLASYVYLRYGAMPFAVVDRSRGGGGVLLSPGHRYRCAAGDTLYAIAIDDTIGLVVEETAHLTLDAAEQLYRSRMTRGRFERMRAQWLPSDSRRRDLLKSLRVYSTSFEMLEAARVRAIHRTLRQYIEALGISCNVDVGASKEPLLGGGGGGGAEDDDDDRSISIAVSSAAAAAAASDDSADRRAPSSHQVHSSGIYHEHRDIIESDDDDDDDDDHGGESFISDVRRAAAPAASLDDDTSDHDSAIVAPLTGKCMSVEEALTREPLSTEWRRMMRCADAERDRADVELERVDFVGHVVLCASAPDLDSLAPFLAPLRWRSRGAQLSNVPVVVMRPRNASESATFWQHLAWLANVYVVRGDASSWRDLERANVGKCRRVVVLADVTRDESAAAAVLNNQATGDDDDQYMLDARTIYTVRSVASNFPMANVVAELVCGSNSQFLARQRGGGGGGNATSPTPTTRRRISSSSIDEQRRRMAASPALRNDSELLQRREAARVEKQLDFHFMPAFAAGCAVPSSFLDTLLAKAVTMSAAVDIVSLLVGGSRSAAQSHASAKLDCCALPTQFVGKRFWQLYEHWLLGARSGGDGGGGGGGDDDDDNDNAENEPSKQVIALVRQHAGGASVLSASSAHSTYVVTCPPGQLVLRADDMCIFLGHSR